MRISALTALACAASASTVTAAKVFAYDGELEDASLSSSSETVDPATARLIVAQRLGLGQFHTLSTTDEETIRQINAFGTSRQPLFRHDRWTETTSRVMIVVEGDHQGVAKSLADARSFSISPSPHPEDTLELFSTFSHESTSVSAGDGLDHELIAALTPLSDLPGSTLKPCNNRRTLLHIKPRLDNEAVVARTISSLLRLARSRKTSLTVIFNPPAHASARPSETPYGLTKRVAKGGRPQPEKPLINQQPSAVSKSLPNAPFSPVMATKVLTGAIPTCFSSRSACERGTNNCTSHGECIRKWSTDSTNDDGSATKRECFGCACTKPEVRTNKDGTKKTTKFGGGACHKKDIVFPFWLLTGVTVFIIFIVTWGIGLLYEMGNQELPSVIGAGVSGPKASR